MGDLDLVATFIKLSLDVLIVVFSGSDSFLTSGHTQRERERERERKRKRKRKRERERERERERRRKGGGGQ